MNVVRDDVKMLVEKELAAANRKYPPFRSAHEGYAVMLEEYEEAAEAISALKTSMECLWDNVRHDWDSPNDGAYEIAISGACELIQFAAMKLKFLDGVRSGWKCEK